MHFGIRLAGWHHRPVLPVALPRTMVSGEVLSLRHIVTADRLICDFPTVVATAGYCRMVQVMLSYLPLLRSADTIRSLPLKSL